MATTTAQEGKLSKQRVSTPTQPRGFSFHTGLTIWKSQVDRAFIHSSLAGGSRRGCPWGSWAALDLLATASPHLAGEGVLQELQAALGQRTGEASPELSAEPLWPLDPRAFCLVSGLAPHCSQTQPAPGKRGCSTSGTSGPWHLPAVYPDDPNLCLWAYHSTIKYIPLYFLYLLSICSVSYIVPSSSWPALCLLHYISPFPTRSPLQNQAEEFADLPSNSPRVAPERGRSRSPLLCLPDYPSFCLDFLFLPHSLPFLCVSLTLTFISEASRSVEYAGTYWECPHGHSLTNQVSRSWGSCLYFSLHRIN